MSLVRCARLGWMAWTLSASVAARKSSAFTFGRIHSNESYYSSMHVGDGWDGYTWVVPGGKYAGATAQTRISQDKTNIKTVFALGERSVNFSVALSEIPSTLVVNGANRFAGLQRSPRVQAE